MLKLLNIFRIITLTLSTQEWKAQALRNEQTNSWFPLPIDRLCYILWDIVAPALVSFHKWALRARCFTENTPTDCYHENRIGKNALCCCAFRHIDSIICWLCNASWKKWYIFHFPYYLFNILLILIMQYNFIIFRLATFTCFS